MAEDFKQNQQRINKKYNTNLRDVQQDDFDSTRANIQRKADAKRLRTTPLPENYGEKKQEGADPGEAQKKVGASDADQNSSQPMRARAAAEKLKQRTQALRMKRANVKSDLGVEDTDFFDDLLIIIKDITDLFTGGIFGVWIGGVIYGIIIIRANNKGTLDEAALKRKIGYHVKLWVVGSIPGFNLFPEIILKKIFPLSN